MQKRDSIKDVRRKRSWSRGIEILRGRRRGILLTTLALTIVAITSKNESPHESRKTTGVILRRDWSSFTELSSLAQHYKDVQNNCDLREKRNPFSKLGMGLGSELHRWTQAICESYSQNSRLRSAMPGNSWTWLDQTSCDVTQAREISPLHCYFPSAETKCQTTSGAAPVSSKASCKTLQADLNITTADVRTAGIEFLFSNVSPLVIAEAQRQLQLVFGGQACTPQSRYSSCKMG